MGVIQIFAKPKGEVYVNFLPIIDHGSRPVRPPFPPPSLSFAFISFSEFGLFNNLQPIQIKKFFPNLHSVKVSNESPQFPSPSRPVDSAHRNPYIRCCLFPQQIAMLRLALALAVLRLIAAFEPAVPPVISNADVSD